MFPWLHNVTVVRREWLYKTWKGYSESSDNYMKILAEFAGKEVQNE